MSRCRLLPCLLLALAFSPAGRAQEVPWRKDYAAARQEAVTTGRPLLLHFTTDGCVWCQKLEQTTYRNPAIFKAMTEQFIPLKIDYQQYEELCKKLLVQSFPTIIIATSRGDILDYHKGYLEAAPFLQLLNRALARIEPPKPAPAPAAPEATSVARERTPVPATTASQKDRPAETPATPVARSVTPPPAQECSRGPQEPPNV